MAFEKAVTAMERNDWIIMTEMLDLGELSAEDLNKHRHKVNMVVDILDLHAIVLTTLRLSASHDGLRPLLLSWAYSVHVFGKVVYIYAVLPARDGQTPTTRSCISPSVHCSRAVPRWWETLSLLFLVCVNLSFSLVNSILELPCWPTQQRKVRLPLWIDFCLPEPI